ncbi:MULTISPECIES: hypothetical protein [unclassified Dysgonomonas]|nr:MULTISPECIES: hypothetical protein [unclassified Dysgonomonas]
MMFLIAIAFSLSAVSVAGNSSTIGGGGKHGQTYHKGNISPKELPKAITKYLKENYEGYTILVSKRKNNGNYFVKIRFSGNRHYSYYRSLVFDNEGRVIKG